MTQIVVDTDVVSFLFKNHPIGRQYDPELAGRIAPISFMTVAEMERWAIQYRWGEHRLHWLHLHPKRLTVTPSSPNLCRKWADAWIAATALLYGVPRVTHNEATFWVYQA
jgi:predicted nucleic acid-binding protein